MEEIQQNIKQNQIIDKILELIKLGNGVITPNEAMANSGYSKDEVMAAFNRLLELYEVRVNLNQSNGGLQFIFKYPLFQRGKKTAKEVLARMVSVGYKVFKTIYKGAVGVVLIAYTIIFALIVIAISLAGNGDRGNGNGNGGSNAGFNLVGVIFRAIFEAMYWHAVFSPIEYAYDANGNRYKIYQKKNKKGANFITSVFQFVFGPEVPQIDSLADAREVAAYIRLISKGKLTAANIIELSGADYSTAESKLAEYAGRFQGNLEISNGGMLYGDFQSMLSNISSDEAKYIEYYKDEVEPPVEFTGNTGSSDAVIMLMNAFNLIMSFVMLHVMGSPIELATKAGDIQVYDLTTFAFLAYFPMIVSASYFIIPLLRYPGYRVRKNNRSKRVLHKKLVGYICAQRRREYQLSDFVVSLKGEWNEAQVKSMLERIIVELEGKMEINSVGQVIYTFDRLFNELSIAQL